MIFVTVGSALPFDRLVRAMGVWAAAHPETELFAQIGRGEYEPQHMGFDRMVSPSEFKALNERAEIIVAHAGMGSVITASELGKPIVLLARHASLREHTTDHQIHTATWLKSRPGIFVADGEAHIDRQIAAGLTAARAADPLPSTAPAAFTDRLRAALLA